jgi:hypothetical protein
VIRVTAIVVRQFIAQWFGLGSGPIYAAFPYKNTTNYYYYYYYYYYYGGPG